jgi:hypothetical protein
MGPDGGDVRLSAAGASVAWRAPGGPPWRDLARGLGAISLGTRSAGMVGTLGTGSGGGPAGTAQGAIWGPLRIGRRDPPTGSAPIARAGAEAAG